VKNRRNYYRILHVDRDAPPEVIRASYRTMMHRLGMHPDHGGDAAMAVLVNEAFATLSDPAARAAYDRAILGEGRPRPALPDNVACAFCDGVFDAGGTDAVCPACGSPLCPAAEHRSGDGRCRAMERFPRELPVSFRRREYRRALLRGSTKDISLNGMRLVSPLRLSVDERVSIEADVYSAVAVVRSVRRCELLGWECGLEFLTLRLVRARGVLVSTVA
jgi:curved DNA-binding protein CbpA